MNLGWRSKLSDQSRFPQLCLSHGGLRYGKEPRNMASVLLSGYGVQRNALLGALCVGRDKEKMRIQI